MISYSPRFTRLQSAALRHSSVRYSTTCQSASLPVLDYRSHQFSTPLVFITGQLSPRQYVSRLHVITRHFATRHCSSSFLDRSSQHFPRLHAHSKANRSAPRLHVSPNLITSRLQFSSNQTITPLDFILTPRHDTTLLDFTSVHDRALHISTSGLISTRHIATRLHIRTIQRDSVHDVSRLHFFASRCTTRPGTARLHSTPRHYATLLVFSTWHHRTLLVYFFSNCCGFDAKNICNS